MCGPWKKTFTLAPLALLIVVSSIFKLGVVGKHGKMYVGGYWKGPKIYIFETRGAKKNIRVLKMLII
jgi:hypothetical protein